jgi:hypothetical protein
LEHRPTDQLGDQTTGEVASDDRSESVALLDTPPQVRITAEAEIDFYRRKQNHVAVRHSSGDSLVAVVEIVSPGNKSSRSALRAFVEKAAEFLDQRIHMLVADLHPPTSRDLQGIHGAIWEEVAGLDYEAPSDEPMTLAAYESGSLIRAFVEPISVGNSLKSMPLYLEPDRYVLVPLESTYTAAFAAQPKRWRTVLTTTTR